MTLPIDLTPELKARLRAAGIVEGKRLREGVEARSYALQALASTPMNTHETDEE